MNNALETRVAVEGGKYLFIVDNGRVRIGRHGEPWIADLQCPGIKAIMALIFELEEAREALKRIRDFTDLEMKDGDAARAEAEAIVGGRMIPQSNRSSEKIDSKNR